MGLMTHTAAVATVVDAFTAAVEFVYEMGISKWTTNSFYASHFVI